MTVLSKNSVQSSCLPLMAGRAIVAHTEFENAALVIKSPLRTHYSKSMSTTILFGALDKTNSNVLSITSTRLIFS